MYAIYLHKIPLTGNKEKRLIYAPNSGDDGYFVTSAKLERGLNISGSLTLAIPPTNPIWVTPISGGGGTVIDPTKVLDQGDFISVEMVENGVGKEIWRGRVVSQAWDIYKNMTVTCEGILSYLNDILLPAYNFYWSGAISQEYNPDEGLRSANLDALKDLIPGMSTEEIANTVEDVVTNVIPSETFTPDQNSIAQTMNNALTDSSSEDNIDRRVSVYDFLVWVLTIYNSELTQGNVDKRKQIKIGYIDPVFKNDIYKINQKTTQYTVAWEQINSAILESFDCILYLSNWHKNESGEDVLDENNAYLYLYKDAIGTSPQIVQYGENLVNYEYERDNTERVSRWYIFGKTKNANGKEILVDMGSVNNGLKYVEVPASGSFIGTIAKAEYTDLTTPKELYDYGMEKLAKNFWASYKLTIDAVDMHLVDPSIDAFEPGKKVRLYMSNEMYNSSVVREFLIETITLDLLNPESSSYTFQKIGETI